ncbi:unnamed protein product [Paramecium sonneborni]|uniref:Uncharacterized protein n=1 Tax=Paramecium sonneborni TaxID=65129 RepID=A0A8S1QAQ4_9CILI|nr:unnamed protein product [Paramecium sonneborni]
MLSLTQTDIQIQQEPTTKSEKQKKIKLINKSVKWTEDTIDNENTGKFKFNVCRPQFNHQLQNCQQSDTCTSDDESNAIDRDKKSKQKHKLYCSKLKLKQIS